MCHKILHAYIHVQICCDIHTCIHVCMYRGTTCLFVPSGVLFKILETTATCDICVHVHVCIMLVYNQSDGLMSYIHVNLCNSCPQLWHPYLRHYNRVLKGRQPI